MKLSNDLAKNGGKFTKKVNYLMEMNIAYSRPSCCVLMLLCFIKITYITFTKVFFNYKKMTENSEILECYFYDNKGS